MGSSTAHVSDFMAERADLPGHEQAWLRELRDQAATQFELMGLPTRRWEAWKYTDLSGLADGGFLASPLKNPVGT